MNNFPKVVIIDDDEDAVELLAYNFGKHELATICFSDSITALNYLKQQKVEMIVTDWMMPGKDGVSLIKELEDSVNSDTKKVMVSCLQDQKSIDKAMKTGIVAYATKPLKINDFIHLIKDNL
jgi:DNA-binding NtrC family response regulator